MCSLVRASSDTGVVSPALVDLSWKLKSCELIASDHDAHGFPWRHEFWSTLQHFLICLHSQQQADNAVAASCFSLHSAKYAGPTQLNSFYRPARWKIKATTDLTGNWELHYSQTSQALLQKPAPQRGWALKQPSLWNLAISLFHCMVKLNSAVKKSCFTTAIRHNKITLVHLKIYFIFTTPAASISFTL